MKRTLTWILAIVIILGGIWLYDSTVVAPEMPPVNNLTPPPSQKLFPETANDPSQMIEVMTPTQNASLTSPFTVTGRARGPWYFEASFPIELKDSNGNVLVTTTGQAQSDWMTENWVPFTATLTFPPQPAGSTGTLMLHNDNPSGEPQNDASISIPVQF